MFCYSMLRASLLALFIVYSGASDECPADDDVEWSYRGKKGPEVWGNAHPECYGEHQSPIAINRSTAVEDKNLEKLEFQLYDQPINEAFIINNGHTVKVVPSTDENRGILVNGVMHTLYQVHFHWGNSSNVGSEHMVDGVPYPLEMHAVHMDNEHNVAVVSILFEVRERPNGELQKIVDKFSQVQYEDEDADLEPGLTLSELLPANPLPYCLYDGSLTTPGCSEGVTWFVARDVMGVTLLQLEEFRKLYSTTEDDAADGCKISGNYRPVQPLNGRQVYCTP